MFFLTPELQNVFNLNRAKFPTDRTYVKNDHPSMNDSVGRLKDLADTLGIDFNETENTFTVVRKENEPEVQVYGPNVMASGKDETVAVPCIVWGRVRKPLSELPERTSYELVESNKRTFVAIDHDDYEEILLLPLILEKDNAGKYPEFLTLKKALKQGKLVPFMKFLKPGGGYTGLKDIPAGEYAVTGYEPSPYKSDAGAQKYYLFLLVDGQKVRVMGNAYLNNKLDNQKPYITDDCQAVLKHTGVTGQTGSGNAKVTCELITKEDLEVPTYDW